MKRNNLTATWFFSQKQKEIIIQNRMQEGKIYHPNLINGIEFTEVQTQQDEPQLSNFDDAVIVCQKFYLPLNEFSYKYTGKIYAKI